VTKNIPAFTQTVAQCDVSKGKRNHSVDGYCIRYMKGTNWKSRVTLTT